MRGLQFFDSLERTPRRLLVAIDAVAVTLVVLALAGTAWLDVREPEVLLHLVWVCLIVEAFLFGLRVTLVRIAAATAFFAGYAVLVDPTGVGAALEIGELALSDWPLMIVVSVIVALMADRVIRTGRRYAANFRSASDRLLTAHEEERLHLAQDLHDGVGQALTGLLLTLDATEKILWTDYPDRPERGREVLHHAQDLAEAALADTRDLAARLRPARLDEAGLADAIGELAARAGRPIELRVDPAVRRKGILTPDRELEVYRIVQEAIANAVGHASADRIWIVLERRGRDLFVQVGDDGIGFIPTASAREGLGLIGMHERAKVLGEHLGVRSSPGAGAVIELVVPLAATADGGSQEAVGVAKVAPR